jgi:6,7-dimethyl-8-ribityllumazine synthase
MTEHFRPHEFRGALDASGLRFGLVVSRFNSFITERLLSGALEALEQGGAMADQTDVIRVPGSFEIPIAAKKLALGRRHEAIIAIGCILRGETAHFDFLASEVSRGIQLAQMDTGVPIIFCVLTCDTLEQAIDRAGLKSGNKGYEAGLAAAEMANLSKQLRPAEPLRGGKNPARGKRR